MMLSKSRIPLYQSLLYGTHSLPFHMRVWSCLLLGCMRRRPDKQSFQFIGCWPRGKHGASSRDSRLWLEAMTAWTLGCVPHWRCHWCFPCLEEKVKQILQTGKTDYGQENGMCLPNAPSFLEHRKIYFSHILFIRVGSSDRILAKECE